MPIDPFVLKLALRKALGVINEDVIVRKLYQELDVAGYEIVKKPGNIRGSVR